MRDIVVIGGSAGSIESVRTIVSSLPADFPASVFVVIHLSSDFPSSLPFLVSSWSCLPASQAVDGELIHRRHIYIARPDHHMTLEDSHIHVVRGPRENRHRPAIDPLFRTAAREFGPRVIGVILSGLLDDGSAGLYAVRERGGIAIVQDPEDAQWSEMPNRAQVYAKPQFVLQKKDIAPTLVRLVNSVPVETAMTAINMKKRRPSKATNKNNGQKPSAETPEQNVAVKYPEESEGTPSVFACPECHGVLWELRDKELVRFRCRVGHSYGADSLSKELSAASESALWAAMRALEEKAAMQRRVADGMNGDKASAKRLRDQSVADDANARLIRAMIFQRDEKLETEEEKEARAPARKSA